MEISRIQPAIAVLISSVVAINAYKRKSLDASGALAGFLVISIHIAAGYRFGAVLLVFFFTSSKLTKIGEEKKQSIDVDFKQGGQRNWIQVLANSGIATVLVVIAWILSRWQDKCLDSNESTIMTCLLGGIIGHYGCCNGDTWSSEIGVLSDSQPRLITTFKPVRKGTNGGVTKIGLLAAAAAGTLIGASFYIFGLFTTKCPDVAFKQILVIPLGTMAGLGGSLIDSLLGATLQFSGFRLPASTGVLKYLVYFSGLMFTNPILNFVLLSQVVGKPGPTVKKISGLSILDNNAVNLVSILLTTLLTAIACLYIF